MRSIGPIGTSTVCWNKKWITNWGISFIPAEYQSKLDFHFRCTHSNMSVLYTLYHLIVVAYVKVTVLRSYLFIFAFIHTSFCVCSFRGIFLCTWQMWQMWSWCRISSVETGSYTVRVTQESVEGIARVKRDCLTGGPSNSIIQILKHFFWNLTGKVSARIYSCWSRLDSLQNRICNSNFFASSFFIKCSDRDIWNWVA